ncbi:gluconokinase isoform X1 [Populus alba x Populus x berolinensis]|uniref:gluconokinase n=1 Tax=Populus alba x Populus x berolinensis TaxID=444605 RepID=A0AAD6LPC0_9ROSI|nr:gluconokinase isoform X1 [Populus alba x Populus x berolinensis]KAJ6969332.1 gluconokinase isoform X1 [Populus alba x Populus x berolinensis]
MPLLTESNLLSGKAIVIMGVSGAGKSENLLTTSLTPVDKMHQGIPLTEEDRIPWLEILQDALRESLISGKTVVLSCSALQKQYREIFRSADCNYHHGSFNSAVKFVLLDAKAEVLAERLDKRAAEGKPFMPAKLLQSQLELLQIDDSEAICKVDATLNPQALVNAIKTLIFRPRKPIAL